MIYYSLLTTTTENRVKEKSLPFPIVCIVASADEGGLGGWMNISLLETTLDLVIRVDHNRDRKTLATTEKLNTVSR